MNFLTSFADIETLLTSSLRISTTFFDSALNADRFTTVTTHYGWWNFDKILIVWTLTSTINWSPTAFAQSRKCAGIVKIYGLESTVDTEITSAPIQAVDFGVLLFRRTHFTPNCSGRRKNISPASKRIPVTSSPSAQTSKTSSTSAPAATRSTPASIQNSLINFWLN